eukprot:scaffold8059_cov68-Cylindrotheca_fusiformis.AAC.1
MPPMQPPSQRRQSRRLLTTSLQKIDCQMAWYTVQFIGAMHYTRKNHCQTFQYLARINGQLEVDDPYVPPRLGADGRVMLALPRPVFPLPAVPLRHPISRAVPPLPCPRPPVPVLASICNGIAGVPPQPRPPVPLRPALVRPGMVL